jgi:peptidoglycan hydrolase CwlO-like protein
LLQKQTRTYGETIASLTDENVQFKTMLQDAQVQSTKIAQLQKELDDVRDKLTKQSQDHEIEVKQLQKERDDVRNEMKKLADSHDSTVKQLSKELDDLKLTQAKQNEILQTEMKLRDTLLKYADLTNQGM